MKIVFLGTNGWYSTDMGNTSCVLIDSEQSYVILDAGDGIYKLDEYIKSRKAIKLFLSHLHLDHIIGFHVFAKFQFKQGMNIYGYGIQTGLKLIGHPYTIPLKELPLKANFHNLEVGKHNLPFPVTSKFLEHSDPCLGFRFKLENKIIAYCTDTGLCDNLYELARNADLLITECSYKPNQAGWRWPHLKPEEAATVAKQANVKQLVLTHFDAEANRTTDERERKVTKARAIFKRTIAAFDNLEIEI
jgi:ribonuclease BN (tRNA processing enzyme)